MDIRFVSTLTAEDEDQIAPTLLKAAAAILDGLSLAYTLRIETTAQTVYQYHHPPVGSRLNATDADASERIPAGAAAR